MKGEGVQRWRKEERRKKEEKRRVKEGPLVRCRVKRVGPPYTILAVVPLVGKWVYKRGPDDSISTHDPTFIPISPNGFLERTSVIARARKKKREKRVTYFSGISSDSLLSFALVQHGVFTAPRNNQRATHITSARVLLLEPVSSRATV